MDVKIKVLHIIKSLGRGGAEVLLPESLKFHDLDRFEFHYIYFLPWKDQMVDAIRSAGGRVTCFPASNNLAIILQSGAVRRYITENQIRLVHCHLPWAGIVGRIIFRSSGMPVIYTEHNKQERYHFLTRWVNRLTFNWQTAVVAVSSDVAHSIRTNISVSVPVYEIPNGVNADFFKREQERAIQFKRTLKIPESALVVGTVSVFRFQKRLKEWLDVFALASRKYPQLYGVIVGAGPLHDEVVQHRAKLGLEQKVLMPGLQTDVKPWYSIMDVFMMTSLFEGLPVALLEAMSMECAVLATAAGGVKEVIRETDGIIVDVTDWIKLADAIGNLIQDPDQLHALQKAARVRASSAFGMARMVKELENLYASSLMTSQP